MNEGNTSEIVAAILTAGLLGQGGDHGPEHAVRLFRQIHRQLVTREGDEGGAEAKADFHTPWR